MLKGVLLGSAAGLIAATAAYAAEPVEYVKVCSLYGAGFYYMPGTDLCIKVGGWVRAEAAWGINGNLNWGPYSGNQNNRLTSNEALRARGYITADARNQTEYGPVRSYIAIGLSTSDTGLQAPTLVDTAIRAFVQWGGMTAGLAQSFYDFYSVPKYQYRNSYLPASDTGDAGWWVWAYTAQFGGGFSGTISAETRRTTQIIDQNAVGAIEGFIKPGPFGTAAAADNTLVNGAYGGMQSPDVVGSLRVDQPWGAAQIMGALHEVNPSYYSTSNLPGSVPFAPAGGHPDDRLGWAAAAGLFINMPFIAQGDSFMAQGNVTRGAVRYLFHVPDTNWGKVDGASEAFGILSDCVYGGTLAAGNTTGCNLTTAYGFNAAYEHYWTPAWHTSIYGAWYNVQYNAQANAMLCEMAGFGNGLIGSMSAGIPGCNMNWQVSGIGSRTQWNVTQTFYIGADVLYENLHSARTGCGSILPGGCPGGVGGGTVAFGSASLVESNSGNLVVTLRAHRDFLP